MNWQPNITLENLHLRAKLNAEIRRFFAERDVLEVETPLLNTSAITDPYLQLLTSRFKHKLLFLQPSPEAAMKRLLAAGSGSIYQISKAFRDDEVGHLHNPEFTLLEWYRIDFDHHQLMDEVDALLQTILHCPRAERLSYQTLFQQFLNIDPLTVSVEALTETAHQQQIHLQNTSNLTKDEWLTLLLSHCIEPKLGFDAPVFVYDYPASMAALAKLRKYNDFEVAERFEVYYRGVELANGYHELTDPEQQLQRFVWVSQQRKQLGLPEVTIDHALIAALQHGLPDCAGVALGIDRLLMLAANAAHIREVTSFTLDHSML